MSNHSTANPSFIAEVSRTNAELQDQINRRRLSEDKKSDAPVKKGEVDITEHQMTPPEVMEKYGTASIEEGLTSSQVEKALEEYGENKLSPAKTKHPLCLLLEQMVGFFSLLLWLAAFLCFLAYGLDQDIDDYLYLGVVLAMVTFFTGIFSFYQEYKSAAIMASFKSFLPKKCFVSRNGKELEIDTAHLVPGDICYVKSGDAIPADMRILKSSDFKVDNSSLTGESETQTRTTENTQENAMEATNLAFFGTNCAKGKCTGLIIRTGDSTLIGTIAHLASSTRNVKTPIALEIEHFIHIVSAVAVFLGVSFLIIGKVRGEDDITNLVFMIGIIVANVPEGLLATVTVSLTLTAKRMATKKVLVKNLESVETLGSTSCIASDKTGTLTQNRMTAVELYFDSTTYPVATEKERAVVTEKATFDKSLMVMALCNNAIFEASDENLEKEIQQRETKGDASESALLKVCEHFLQNNDNLSVHEFRKQHTKIGEIPFNSTNKYQVSVHTPNNNEDSHRLLVMKGAPERIWNICSEINIEGKVVKLGVEHKQEFDVNINEMMFKGERVLGLCYAELDQDEWEVPVKDASGLYDTECETYDPSKDHIFGKEPYNASSGTEATPGDIKLIFCGLIALIDPPRPSVPRAVQLCQKAGIKVIMVTGDHPETAESIARKVNIIRDKTERDVMRETGEEKIDAATDPRVQAIVIPGKKLAMLSNEQLDSFLDYDQIVFARTSPAQKLKIVKGLQDKKFIYRGFQDQPKPVKLIVAVTGDGVNDSPALKQADIGIAMGIAGTQVAKDAADMILLDDNFASIVRGVEEGRLIFDNLKKSIAYTLSSNIPEISPFLIFILASIPLPLPTFLILCVDLGTDMVPAISLAYEGKEANIMTKPPRDARTDRLVTGRLICFSYLQIGVIQAAAGFYAYVVVLKDFGFTPSILPGSYWAFENEAVSCFVKAGDVGPLDEKFSITQRCGFYSSNTAIPSSKFKHGVSIEGRQQVWFGNENYNTTQKAELLSKNGMDMWAYHTKLDQYKQWAYIGRMTQCFVNEPKDCWNPAEALKYAQTAFFISIIIVQWSDILACKTRTLSLRVQGMRNNMLNFGLFFETALGALISYLPFVNSGLNTRSLFFVHWLVALPFCMLILSYDEVRKLLMRNMSAEKGTWLKKESEGDQPENWVYRNTYY